MSTVDEKIMQIELEKQKVELERQKVELEIQKNDVINNINMNKRDAFQTSQEVIRRGIEVINSILKTERKYEIKSVAESKLIEFIEALEIPKS